VSLRAVTFDCWSTLLYEHEPMRVHEKRVGAALEITQSIDSSIEESRVRRAYDEAWERHFERWHAGIASGAPEIARWTLESLAIRDLGAIDELAKTIAEAGLEGEIAVLDGALETLERLADGGFRRALICDTGLSPGSVVRRQLERADLLGLLEIQLFSDEAGVPKPDPRMFRSALSELDVAAHEALHVGDLRRTDVAGARQVGMRTARIRGHHDDQSELPDADHVVDSHHEVWELVR